MPREQDPQCNPQVGEEVGLKRAQPVTERRSSAMDGLESLFDNNPAPGIIYDASTLGILAANRAAIYHYGYSSDEWLSMTVGDLLAETGPARAARAAYSDSNQFARHLKKDGTLIDVEISSRDIAYRGREARLITVHDVTGWRQAAESWDQERQLFRSLMDQLPVFIYAKDRDSRFVLANMTVAAAKGEEDPENMIGKSDFDYYPPDLASEYRAIEQGIMNSGHGFTDLEVYERDKNGKASWFLNARVPWRDRAGNVIGILGVNRDITDRKQTEAALEKSLAEFETIVSAVSEGNLTRRAAEDGSNLGRIAQSVNEMLDNFSKMIAQVKSLGLTVSSSATQILAASEEISTGSRRQAEEITNASSAVEEMAASMSQVSRNASNTADAARRALNMAQRSDAAVHDAFQAMERIDFAVQTTAEKMQVLARRSSEISEILAMIGDIASQTNLLSLNAAIQA